MKNWRKEKENKKNKKRDKVAQIMNGEGEKEEERKNEGVKSRRRENR